MPQRVGQSKRLPALAPPLQGGRIKLARDGMILLHQTVAVAVAQISQAPMRNEEVAAFFSSFELPLLLEG